MSAAGPARPLSGLRVVVTRAAHQAGATARAFEQAGARVAILPLLELVSPNDPGPLAAALASLDGYAWIVFTSANAVERVLGGPRAREAAGAGAASQRSAIQVGSLPPGLRVASVGEATSEALRSLGIEPELEPGDARAEGVAAVLAPRVAGGARVLLPQAADARPVLENELARAGARVDRVDAYAKRTPPGARERMAELFGDPDLGWVTFTSPSIARAFADLGSELWGGAWPERRRTLLAASIGPVTSAALRQLGIDPAAEAATPSDEELVAAVARSVASPPEAR